MTKITICGIFLNTKILESVFFCSTKTVNRSQFSTAKTWLNQCNMSKMKLLHLYLYIHSFPNSGRKQKYHPTTWTRSLDVSPYVLFHLMFCIHSICETYQYYLHNISQMNSSSYAHNYSSIYVITSLIWIIPVVSCLHSWLNSMCFPQRNKNNLFEM